MQRSPHSSFTSRAAASALGLLFLSGAAFGDTLVMKPQELKLAASKPVAHLQFRNDSAEETTLSFEVRQWQQEGEREWLSPSTKLIVLPEKIKLQPGESGRVRVGLRLSAPWWEEEAFRILVTETPRIPDVGSRSTRGRVTRQSSLPVFLLPPGEANARLSWSFKRNSEGAVVLRASNNGKAHVRLSSASLLGPAGQSIEKANMSAVLLPGGARSWQLAPDAAPRFWHLTAHTNEGPMQAELKLDPDDSTARALTFSE